MIMRWPESIQMEAKRGQARTELVELRDVLPTFLDAAGMPKPEVMDGASMLDILRDKSWRKMLDLEHAQIYFFHNNGDEEYFIGSADLMMRNLESRVEVVAPVLPTFTPPQSPPPGERKTQATMELPPIGGEEKGGTDLLLDLLRAAPKLDLLVTVDWRMSNTALYSDYVLPAGGWYEKNDFVWGTSLYRYGVVGRFLAGVLCLEDAYPACGACRSCELLAGGAHPDGRLLSFEQHPKRDELRTDLVIDQVRRLTAGLQLTTTISRRKAAVIFPSEAMTRSAANALLKTLEEPPGDMERLRKVEGVGRRAVGRWGRKILELVRTPKPAPARGVTPRTLALEPDARRRLKRLLAARDARAQSLGLEPGLLCPRGCAERVAAQEPRCLNSRDLATAGLEGWRLEVLGEDFLSALDLDSGD